jgi:glycerate-2-kinase
VCLAISDVVGDDLSVIGSGPTVPDPSTYRDAWGYIERFGVESQLTQPAKDYLRAGLEGTIAETPKAGDRGLTRSLTRVIGGRFDAMKGAAEAARQLGYEVVLSEEPIVGDARTMGPIVLERARSHARAGTRPMAVIASGETTVKVVGKGRGGRNQELALSVAKALAADSSDIALASIGTDGIDGPTDAAGALCGSHHPPPCQSAIARRRGVSRRQQRLRVFPASRRPHHHRPVDDQRRRPPGRPFPLNGLGLPA